MLWSKCISVSTEIVDLITDDIYACGILLWVCASHATYASACQCHIEFRIYMIGFLVWFNDKVLLPLYASDPLSLAPVPQIDTWKARISTYAYIFKAVSGLNFIINLSSINWIDTSACVFVKLRWNVTMLLNEWIVSLWKTTNMGKFVIHDMRNAKRISGFCVKGI